LRRIVFESEPARRDLEAITHPRIRALLAQRSNEAGGAYQIWVIPLLVEGKGRIQVDRVLLVDCPEALQIERVMQRDGGSREQAEAILGAQASRAARLSAADDVIVNDGDPARLDAAVAALHQRYLEGLRTRSG
jgi:dephospho-CoA kinase